MKKIIIALLVVVALVGYTSLGGTKQVDSTTLTQNQGVVYNTDNSGKITPYNGKSIKYGDQIIDGKKQVLIETNYKDGKKDGMEKSYYSTGEVYTEQEFQAGIPVNTAKIYYPNGKVKQEISYKNGKIDGELKTYYENGKVVSKLSYKIGILDGKKEYYNYKNGVEVKTTPVKVIKKKTSK